MSPMRRLHALTAALFVTAAAPASAQTPPSSAPRPASPTAPAAPARAPAPEAQRPPPLPANATKAEMVSRLVVLTQGLAVAVARGLVEQPMMALQQQAALAIQQRFPPDAREAAMKDVQAEVRKYVDDVSPIMRDTLQRFGPQTMGATFEEKFTEEELRQLITLLESPVLRKYEQVVPELQRSLQQKMAGDVRARFTERAKVLEQAVSARIAAGPGAGASATPAAPAASAARRP